MVSTRDWRILSNWAVWMGDRSRDAAAASIALSAVAGTVAANYQTCHENAEQLRALQAWVREMNAAARQ